MYRLERGDARQICGGATRREGAKAGPRAVRGPRDEVGGQGVALKRRGHRQEVLVGLHHERCEPPLVDVARARTVSVGVPSLSVC